MNLIVIGTNHKYSPIALREKISFSKSKVKDALSFLKESYDLKGAVILSTCNRVEFYASVEDIEKGSILLEDFIFRYREIDRQKISPYFYRYNNEQALRHLFLVACGLDSLILGETEILGQVKSAFLEAGDIGFLDECLEAAFGSAISFAKEIQQKTKIWEGRLSIGNLTIDFIKERLGSLTNKNILIIGIGKVTELVLEHLSREKPNVVFISNRSFHKANELAGRIGAKAFRFDQLKQYLNMADALITASASPHFIIKKDTLNGVKKQRLLIVDLGVPRNVDPAAKEIKEVDLFCLEDLESVIKKSIDKNTEAAKVIQNLIDIETERLCRELIRSELAEAPLP